MRPPLRALMIVGAIAVLALVGCGRKDDPLPVPRSAALTIGAVETVAAEGGVGLRWSVQGETRSLAHFRIFRSDPAERCPGCPREARLLVQLPLKDERLGQEGQKGFRYLDREALPGLAYGYQVVGCDRAGRCSAPSPESLVPQGGKENEPSQPKEGEKKAR